ncbi:helix-turn-helix domain-containing protein [Kitasatospora purpeofusca]|uniref:helix-turn-helix domain-containing protein n=1 Tax=Kitasatospora purpeofusca TaxID=67352 RepID=UPI00365C19B3
MKWNLRMVAAQRDLWRPTEVLAAFQEVGFHPSLSKVAALWGGKPVTVRLDDLDLICAALDCTVADLLQAEPAAAQGEQDERIAADGSGDRAGGRPRPVPRTHRPGGPRLLPPS